MAKKGLRVIRLRHSLVIIYDHVLCKRLDLYYIIEIKVKADGLLHLLSMEVFQCHWALNLDLMNSFVRLKF